MSPEIVDLCLEYSHIYSFPIMIIASRNQVDVDSGYAFTTSSLAMHVKDHKYYDPSRVLVCRDHCGPYFSDLDHGLTLQHSTGRCIETILTDIEHGFDLIHIDVGRINPIDQERVAKTLFGVAKSANPNIAFEYGSEDNTGKDMRENLDRLHSQIEFVGEFKPNLKFLVSQTGSLTKHTQVGTFDNVITCITADLIHANKLLFKEHNADYLTREQVALHRKCGIDSFNIAPQLGSIHTSILCELGRNLGSVYTDFHSYVLAKEFWKRWTTEEVKSDLIKVIASGHYCLNSLQGVSLQTVIGEEAIMEKLRPAVFKVLDEYRFGLLAK